MPKLWWCLVLWVAVQVPQAHQVWWDHVADLCFSVQSQGLRHVLGLIGFQGNQYGFSDVVGLVGYLHRFLSQPAGFSESPVELSMSFSGWQSGFGGQIDTQSGLLGEGWSGFSESAQLDFMGSKPAKSKWLDFCDTLVRFPEILGNCHQLESVCFCVSGCGLGATENPLHLPVPLECSSSMINVQRTMRVIERGLTRGESTCGSRRKLVNGLGGAWRLSSLTLSPSLVDL